MLITEDKKKRLRLTVKVVFTIALLYYLINYVSYSEIIEAIRQSNKFYIFLVFMLMFLNISLQFLKWRVVCNSLLHEHDNKKIWKSLFYGLSGGIITPVRVGEYLGRKFALDNHSLMRITISTMIEKFTSLLVVIFVGGIVSIMFISTYFSIYYAIPIILLILLLVGLIIYFMRGNNISSKRFNNLAEKYNFVKNLKLEIKYAREIDSNSIRNLVRIAVFLYSVIILQYALLAKAFDQSGDLILFLAAGSIILFVKSILSFLSFADLGIRESTSVFLLNKMGYSNAVGFNSAIFLFVFNLLIPAVIGMILLFKREKK